MSVEGGSTSQAVVLIAEDNDEARRMLEVRVKREGYSVLLAEHGRKALDLLAQHAVDMILLDIYMPEKNGFDVLAAVKANPRWAQIPVVMISGAGDQEDLVRCIEMGAIDYLPKPYNQAHLRARLVASIANKRQREQEIAVTRSEHTAPTCISSPNPAVASGPPQRLGRVVVEQLLGSGSMGQVYLGRHELYDMPVAVKLLRPELQTTQEMQARVLREAQLAIRISHRNIVRLYEAGESEHGIYLAYEYMDGGTLAQWLRRRPRQQMEVMSAIKVTGQIAAGLGEIGRLCLTHRDIKPANILLTQDRSLVKIGDLGLIKKTGGVLSPLSAEHVILGTPEYMSPEAVQGPKDVDIRSDLYSLGVVLYEMLTGAPPFTRQTPMATLLAHMGTPVPPPTQFRPDIPLAAEAICLKLLAKERSDRYETPEAVVADLKPLLAQAVSG